MQSGKLRHRVSFQQKTQTRDENDFLVDAWQAAADSNGSVLTDIPAEVLTGPGKELIAAGATHNQVAARINVRWFPGLSPSWRILWDGQTYEIIGYSTDVTGRKELRLICSAGVVDG